MSRIRLSIFFQGSHTREIIEEGFVDGRYYGLVLFEMISIDGMRVTPQSGSSITYTGKYNAETCTMSIHSCRHTNMYEWALEKIYAGMNCYQFEYLPTAWKVAVSDIHNHYLTKSKVV